MIKSRSMGWTGHAARMAVKRTAYRILVGKRKGKRPVGRHRRTWEKNIKTDLRETGWDSTDWINLTQDRNQWRALVNTVMNFLVEALCYNSEGRGFDSG
jgi:hypothetical protein